MFKKYQYLAVLIFFTININTALATIKEDADIIFNWAEKEYPQYFTNSQITQILDIWYYRYYPETGVYVGVNDANEVYVMGGEFGDSPLQVGTVSDFLTVINTSNSGGIINPGNGNCVAFNRSPAGTVTVHESIPDLPGIPLLEDIPGFPGIPLSPQYIHKTDTILESTATHYTTKTEKISRMQSDGFSAESVDDVTDTNYIKIIDGIVYITKNELTSSSRATILEAFGIPFNEAPTVITLDTVTMFSPFYFSTVINERCEEQSWYKEPVGQSQTGTQIYNGESSNISLLEGFTGGVTDTVEAIDDSITVPAGTFITVRIRQKENSQPEGTYSIYWYSAEHSILIKHELYIDDELVSGKQLISFSQ